jgi:hypothetical protein
MPGNRALSQWKTQRHWDLMLPPGRPSGAHLSYFASQLGRLHRSLDRPLDVCILGSTPELRDLCYELSCRSVLVLDNSPEFHAAVAKLCIYTNSRESVIFDDWTECLSQHEDRFDAILSDLTLGNIPYDFREQFFGGLRRALRGGGVFIDKVLTADPLQSLDQLDERYRHAPLNLVTINDFTNDYFFLSELIRGGVVDVSQVISTLSDRFAKERRLMRILHESSRLVTPNGFWYYGRPWLKVLPTYATGLQLTDCSPEPPPSVFCDQVHLHCFTKRG